jgi:hypothetical protein
VNITKYEHQIIIGILVSIIGFGIGSNIGQEKSVEPIKVIKKVEPKEMTPDMARKLAKSKLDDFGWSSKQWSCLSKLWGKESAWNYKAVGPTNDHGIPQRHMSKNTKKEIHAFQSDPVKQINWGLNYIDSRYSSPCGAWSFWEVNRWY